jgi:predicted negative regulator of RcsB-dependent stress response
LTCRILYGEISAMAKKKKEEIKKSDILITTIESTIAFVKKNLRSCIIGVVIVLAAAFSVYAYTLYERKQDEKVQYVLAQGIQSFDLYSLSGKKDALDNAEKIFQDVINEKRGRLSMIAKLYLGKVCYIRGKNEEAKKLYSEVSGSSSDTATRSLAEKALEHIIKQ